MKLKDFFLTKIEYKLKYLLTKIKKRMKLIFFFFLLK